MPVTDISQCLVAFKESIKDVAPESRQRVLDAADAYAQRAASTEIDGIDTRLAQDIKDAAEQAEIEKLVAKRNAYLNFKAEGALFNHLTGGEWEDAPQEALNAFFYGSNVGRANAKDSIGAAQESLSISYRSGLLARLNEERSTEHPSGLMFFMQSPARDKELFLALSQAHSRNPDFTGMQPDAVKAAQIISEYQELARKDANFHGAYIGQREGWAMTRTHDMHKIYNAGEEEWTSYMMEGLDWDRTFKDIPEEKRLEKLQEDWGDFARGEHLKAPSSRKKSEIPAGLSSLAKPLSHQRVYHFKNQDLEYDYHSRYGIGHVGESIDSSLGFMALNTGLMAKLGPNAQMNMERAIKRAKKTIADSRKDIDLDRKFSNRVKYIESKVWPNLTGEANIPGHHMGASWSFSLRVTEALAKLGGAGFSAVGDVPIMSSALKRMGVEGYLGGIMKGFSEISRPGETSPEWKSFMASVGAGMDGLGASIAKRYDGVDAVPGRMTKAMNVFFKINGLTYMTDRTRLAFTKAMGQAMYDWRGLGFDKLRPETQNTFNRAGITPKRWDVIRKNGSEKFGDFNALVPEQLKNVSDEDITNLLKAEGRPVTKRTVNEMRRELVDQFRAFYHDRAMTAVIVPNASVRGTINQGLKPGTIAGELLRLVMQFKGFPLAVVRQAFGEEMFSRTREVGLGAAMNRSAMMGLTQFIIATGTFGYLVMSAKDIMKNRTPRTPEDMGDVVKIFASSIVQGGGLGIYGDFLFGEMKNRYGGGPLETFAGPAFGTFDDLFAIWGDVQSGEPNASRAYTFALSHLPGNNLPGLKAAFDYAIGYEIRDYLAPGYLKRFESRLDRENDQQFLISPR